LPTFYAAKILTHWARGGDKIVDAKSDSPLLSAHAARLANGNLALLVINKNPTDDIGAEIGLENFLPGSTTAKLYQYGKPNDAQDSPNPDITESSLGEVSASFRHVFPSYSMSVIVLEKP
jgi:alpha-L-arabinofuranosidase